MPDLAAPAELRATLLSHERVAPDAGILRFRTEPAPPRFAPGQFLQVRPWTGSDPLLARPFSILDQGEDWLSLLYQVMGRGTEMMSGMREGDEAVLVGPLGRPFAPPGRTGAAVIVAGGVGIPPFLLVVRDLVKRGVETKVLLGARDRAHLYLQDEMAREGATVRVATDDGSEGHQGYVTELLAQEIAVNGASSIGAVYTCGPEPMMEAVVRMAREHGIPGQASMERHMACGYGVCFTCVMALKQTDGSFHNERTCLVGPVLPFNRLPEESW